MKTIFVDEKEEVCANCKFYHQHYIYANQAVDKKCYIPCHAGHCTYPRIKERKPSTPACNYFIQYNEITERRNQDERTCCSKANQFWEFNL